MQVTIAATSSHLDEDTVLIEVSTTIGDSVSVQRCGYSKFELSENRYLSGTLEERIEKLRESAQSAAEHSFKAQYAALLDRMDRQPMAQPGVVVLQDDASTEEVNAATLAAESFVEAGMKATVETPVKKTRKPRATKTESQE